MFTGLYGMLSDPQAPTSWSEDFHTDMNDTFSAPQSAASSISSSATNEQQYLDNIDMLALHTNPYSYNCSNTRQSNNINGKDGDTVNVHLNQPLLLDQHASLAYSPSSSGVSPTAATHVMSDQCPQTSNYAVNEDNYCLRSSSRSYPAQEVPVPVAVSTSASSSGFEVDESENIPFEEQQQQVAASTPTTATTTTIASSTKKQGTTTAKKPATKKRVKKPMTLVQRKAHNKIERKYRININSKIASLQKLVPWMSEDGVAFEIDHAKARKNPCSDEFENDESTSKKLNKSKILDLVTEYLSILKDECHKKDAEISQLRKQLEIKDLL
jgi:hypothetical protein